MAPNLPKLLALLVNSYGLFIFRNPTTCIVHQFSTLMPSLIFALAIYSFTIDLSYFKLSFRKIFIPCQFVLEFLSTAFVLEMALLDFWFPLEKFVLSQLLLAADLLKVYHCLGLGVTVCCYLYSGLRSPITAMAASYSLSLFFLSCVLQGTNVIDFKLLRCGVDVFINSLIRKIRKGMCQLWPYKGMKGVVNSCSRRNRCDGSSDVYVQRKLKR